MGGPFWKPDYRAAKKQRLGELLRLRKQVRMRVLARDDFRCRACRCRPTPWTALEVHEEPPRSRGGDPLNEKECIALCHKCHKMRTGEVGKGQTLSLWILDPERGTAGPVRFLLLDGSGREWVTSGLRGRDEE